MENQRPSNLAAGAMILVPVLIVTGVWLAVGWALARAGASYRAVRAAMYPAFLAVGSVLGIMPFIAVGWIIAAVTGNTPMANYVVGNASELALLSSAFGDPLTVPVWHVAVYQFFVWLLITRPMAEDVTTLIYNSARAGAAR